MSILYLATLMLGGYLLMNIVDSKSPVFEKISVGFILLLAIITNLMFLCNWAGLSYSFNSSLAITVTLIVCLLSINTLLNRNAFRFVIPKFNLSVFLFFLFLSLPIIVSDMYWPVKDWDSLALYDFRARSFVATGFMNDAISRGYFFGYPLWISLVNSLGYIWRFSSPLIFQGLVFIFFLVAIYEVLCKKFKISSQLSLLSILFIVLCPKIYLHSLMSYTNLPYLVYFDLGSLYLIHWMKNHQLKYLFLSSLLVGFSTWVRSSEPFWLVPLLFVTVVSFRKRQYMNVLMYVVVLGLIRIPWFVFESINKVVSNSPDSHSIGIINAILFHFNFLGLLTVIKFIFSNVVMLSPLVFACFLIVIFFRLIKNNSNGFLSTYILCIIVLLVGSTFVFSVIYPGWDQIPDSLSRMVMFVFPLIVIDSILFINEKS